MQPSLSQTPAPQNACITVFTPLRVRKRGGHKMVILPTTACDVLYSSPPEPAPNLIKALTRAALWEQRLRTQAITLGDLAKAEGKTPKYIQLILRLNFLAPDIKQTILEGRQPRDLRLADLTRQPIPLLWQEQRAVFKFLRTSI